MSWQDRHIYTPNLFKHHALDLHHMCSARTSAHLEVAINGQKFTTALIDMGADYCIITGTFAVKLNKVATMWHGA